MYTLTPSFCVSVEECGCEGMGSMGVTVWGSVGVRKHRYMYVGVGVWRRWECGSVEECGDVECGEVWGCGSVEEVGMGRVCIGVS